MPDCDDSANPKFGEPWVLHAVPGTNKGSATVFVPEQCEQFEVNRTVLWIPDDTCPAEWFSEKRVTCDRWVFEKGEKTIVNDVCVKRCSVL